MLRATHTVLVVTLAALLAVPAAFGQGSTPGADALRPADTSSPRDTLRGFVADTSQFIEEFRKGRRGQKTFRALVRASQALDYSATPDGDSWYVRNRRMALLQEVLARIELPPAGQVPGDEQVADGSITQWTIPGTEITIARIASGPRAGQFLFSAATVLDLDRLYRQAKDLPYRQGATRGIYEEMVSAEASVQAQEAQLRALLTPIDTSSPRSTFEGFLDHVNRAYELASEANEALRADPPTMTREQARQAEAEAFRLLRRAGDTLDLRKVPEALRENAGTEAALVLKEVLDRMLLPPLDALPTAQMVEAARRKGPEESSRPRDTPFRWRLSNTPVEIVEIVEGERQGQYLFSAGTVLRLGEIYDKVAPLPYRHTPFDAAESEHRSPGLSPGFYESYLAASGHLVPQAHVLSRTVDALPKWFRTTYAGHMVWQWAGLVLATLLTVLAAYVAHRRIRRLAKRSVSPRRDWLHVLGALAVLAIVVAVDLFIGQGLQFASRVQVVVTIAAAATIYLLLAWAAFALSIALAETLVATPRLRSRTSDAALVRTGAWLTGFVLAIWIVVVGLRSLGADLIPLLAGLGIGGLAVALAAQSTIANFIGSLILLANKPVQVGDFCRYGEDPSAGWLRIGTVEEINWMSTRIRGIDRTVTTIPNAAFAGMHIVNLTKRDRFLVLTTLQLRYETSAEQIRDILVRLRELLLGHPRVSPDPARARFVRYGAYSKDIEIFCYVRCLDYGEFLAIQEDLLLRIEDIVAQAGSGFAFPSQTAYLARDGGLDDKQRQGAEARVEQLRQTGKLPFPEFEEEDRRRLEDVLDYPPKGSPGHRPRDGGTDSKAGK